MGKQDEFFKMYGAKELGKELRKLSRGTQNKILRPALSVGAAEIRKIAKKNAPKKSGLLKSEVKSKVFTAKRRAKGLVAKIGVLGGKAQKVHYYPQQGNEEKPRPVLLVAHYHNQKLKFLDKALEQGNPQAVKVMLARFQEKLTAFHAKEGDKGKRR
jgi:HK97 gp10 family phage protein